MARCPRRPSRALSASVAVACLALAAAGSERDPQPSGSAAGEPPAAFEPQRLAVPGRPLDVSPALVARGPALWLVVFSVEGTAPDERRHVSIFSSQGPGGPLRLESSHALPPDVVRFDAAELVPGGGLELALLSARRLEVVRPGGPGPARSVPLEPPLPLPPGVRGVGREPILARWEGDGRVSALLPAHNGFALLPLPGAGGGARARRLSFPLLATYLAGDDDAGVRPGVLEARVAWPEVAIGDDDGDGRADLLALSRYEVAVYRSGASGLPASPSRRAALRPFTPEEELRWPATSVSIFARDLDGDGLVDLAVHRTLGTLLRSDATTSFYRNRGDGADPTAPPDARIEGRGGFGSVFLEDLDRDGRVDPVQTLVPFGVVQLIRAILTQTVQAELRAYRFGRAGFAPAELTFADTFALPIDAEEGRLGSALPSVRGDFDGDGRRDLLFAESGTRLAIRLGVPGARGPAFGRTAARQDVPFADRAFVGDLDGDGLDDLVVYDTRSDGGGVTALRNLSALAPGRPRPAELRAADE